MGTNHIKLYKIVSKRVLIVKKMEKKQTAVEWLVDNAEDFFGGLLAPSIIDQAKQMEKEQMGYTKDDVLKAGEIGEINHHDYKHIVKLLDEARELNRTNK